MPYRGNQEDINALFKANTAVHGEVLSIKRKGENLPIKVTVKVQKAQEDKDYSLVKNANISTGENSMGCQLRTYTVRQGLYIDVFVKNLHTTPIELRVSWFDDHQTRMEPSVTIKPQSEYKMPMQFRLEAHETKNDWNLFFNNAAFPMLILTFKRDENGEETIDELLNAMEKLVKTYRRSR